MRIAVLDLGTNTFHLLIVDVNPDRSFEKIFKSKVSVKLGEGAIDRKFIAAVPFERGIRALKHYREIIGLHKPEKIFAFATSAIRSAVNGKEFVAEAKRKAGIHIRVIAGDEEAELICYGVRQCIGMNTESQLIMDIGGGSTEFIIANDKKIFWKKSFDIGASRLLETFKPSDRITQQQVRAIEKYLSRMLSPLDAAMERFPVKSLIGSSGSFDTFAEIIGWRFHGRNILKGVSALQFNLDEYFRLHQLLLKSDAAARNKMKGLIKMRVDMIVLASICTNFILKRYGLEAMYLSKNALKEGALWNIIRKQKH